MPASAVESAMTTRFGTVAVQRSTAESPPDTLAVNGNAAFVAEWEYIGLYSLFSLGGTDVVLFGVNCGGTGCPNDNLGFLVLGPGQPPRAVTNENFFSNDGTVAPRLADDRIVVDLGYDAGRRKIAEFDLNDITIRTERQAATPMAADQCQWLYEHALADCVQAKNFDASCSEPRQYFSGVVERSLSALSNHPGFIAAGFDAACAAACTSGEAPQAAQFRSAACGIR